MYNVLETDRHPTEPGCPRVDAADASTVIANLPDALRPVVVRVAAIAESVALLCTVLFGAHRDAVSDRAGQFGLRNSKAIDAGL